MNTKLYGLKTYPKDNFKRTKKALDKLLISIERFIEFKCNPIKYLKNNLK